MRQVLTVVHELQVKIKEPSFLENGADSAWNPCGASGDSIDHPRVLNLWRHDSIDYDRLRACYFHGKCLYTVDMKIYISAPSVIQVLVA